MEEIRPSWLVRMEHGSIGEARTRAFLLNRFWVLERSVDIDSADYIIQRRLTGQNLLDPTSPRFGVVQVKFFGTPTTTQDVHREYVVDKEGRPRPEFFLIAHTGGENDARTFLLHAKDVVDAFACAPEGHSRAGRFVLPGKQVLDPRYEVVSPSVALDRMEATMRGADFRANRLFMAWAPQVSSLVVYGQERNRLAPGVSPASERLPQ